ATVREGAHDQTAALARRRLRLERGEELGPDSLTPAVGGNEQPGQIADAAVRPTLRGPHHAAAASGRDGERSLVPLAPVARPELAAFVVDGIAHRQLELEPAPAHDRRRGERDVGDGRPHATLALL